jgi:RsiW-degrading membrane proteinase PrsW (M82 family)
MTYIENIYLCIALPVMLAVLCTNPRARVSMLFLLSGMTVCLFSSYISTFLASVMRTDLVTASVEITPLVEECMKLLPVLFGLLVFDLHKRDAAGGILMTSVGFATFENVCFLSANGASDLPQLLLRGAATGALHIVCGYLVGLGLLFLWDMLWLRTLSTVALVCLVSIYHSIYNLLVSQGGWVRWIGYFLPLVTLIPAIHISRYVLRQQHL